MQFDNIHDATTNRTPVVGEHPLPSNLCNFNLIRKITDEIFKFIKENALTVAISSVLTTASFIIFSPEVALVVGVTNLLALVAIGIYNSYRTQEVWTIVNIEQLRGKIARYKESVEQSTYNTDEEIEMGAFIRAAKLMQVTNSVREIYGVSSGLCLTLVSLENDMRTNQTGLYDLPLKEKVTSFREATQHVITQLNTLDGILSNHLIRLRG
jgi:hypothetical protein